MTLNNTLRFKIALQTIKDNAKLTVILTLLFMMMVAVYAGMFPSFEEALLEMANTDVMEGFNFFPHADQMHTYVGFLTIELYTIFWLLILAIIIGFIAASTISREIEGKTIDLLMSNPVSRKQIVFEKFIGLVPMFLIVNFATMIAVIGITEGINQTLNYNNLFMVHVISIPYFLAVFSIGILVSVIINEKMRASIFLIAVLFTMFIINSISLMTPDYEFLGSFSLFHYFDTFDVLANGNVDVAGVFVMIAIITACLVISMIYFENKDIPVS